MLIPGVSDLVRFVTTQELINRCSRSGDTDAWLEFVSRFHRVIASVVLRTAARHGGLSSEAADDLIQDTYLKLCANDFRLLRDFQASHPEAFFGFVKVVAANLVRDHFKAIHTERRGRSVLNLGEPAGMENIAAQGLAGHEAITRNLLLAEVDMHLRACLGATDPQRDYRIFWLYYRAGLSASKIAALPDIHLSTKGVESLILRLTRELRERMGGSSQPRLRAAPVRAQGVFPAESL